MGLETSVVDDKKEAVIFHKGTRLFQVEPDRAVWGSSTGEKSMYCGFGKSMSMLGALASPESLRCLADWQNDGMFDTMHEAVASLENKQLIGTLMGDLVPLKQSIPYTVVPEAEQADVGEMWFEFRGRWFSGNKTLVAYLKTDDGKVTFREQTIVIEKDKVTDVMFVGEHIRVRIVEDGNVEVEVIKPAPAGNTYTVEQVMKMNGF
ncbi:MAG: hypothetical protein CMF31_04585 [Kordiimonas sp.]|nr:hypothetical protein [Kordiimonas sp.]